MFNRKFKLIGTAVGLVAVLVMGLALPGVTQQTGLARQNIVGNLNNALQTLTAAEGDIWNTECAQFFSDERFTLAFIPLHPASRSLQRLLEKDAKDVTLEALYIPEDIPGFLKAGIYLRKVVDPNVNPATVVIVDQEGKVVHQTTTNVVRSDKPTVEDKACLPRKVTFSNPEIIIIEKCYVWCLWKETTTIIRW